MSMVEETILSKWKRKLLCKLAVQSHNFVFEKKNILTHKVEGADLRRHFTRMIEDVTLIFKL